jgi:endonuclease YncB( thermonuclease family)
MRKTPMFVASALLAFFLASCGTNGASSSENFVSSESVAASSERVVSSSEESSSAAVCDSTDYVSQVHLTLNYVGHDFLTDGIGQVALKELVDGDTTHFYDLNSNGTPNTAVTIKSRYLCIDTPESTGQIEPWGKAASAFTDSYITSAKTIVLSSDFAIYGSAKADSTGSRYLSYIWVSDQTNAPLSSFRLLNLIIVQNGYSATKAAAGTLYQDTFFNADAEAQCNKLIIWSGQQDPGFIYTTGVSTTLQLLTLGKIYDETVGDYVDYDWTDSTHNKVAFDCYVALATSGNAYVYMDYPALDNPNQTVRYGMYIFAGYRNITPLNHVGWKLNVVGNCTTFNGNLQITNVQYNVLYHTTDDITILDKTLTTYTPLETATAVADTANIAYMNVVVQINDLHGVNDFGTYSSVSGTDTYMTIHCEDLAGSSIYLTFTLGTVTDRNNVTQRIDPTNFVAYFCTAGETFNVFAPINRYISTGGTIYYQLALCHNSDLVFNS